MPQLNLTKAQFPKVHFSEYIRTYNAQGDDSKPEETAKPETPEAK